ncbi:cupin domain-containing protein [Oceanibaculum nanhaiense]|uniref:hypothetical protein n=1 Tax=Oceanibaculum nanhaiense TaxID=1909734 RepID=UPI000A3CBE4B|nr:hypothetical protein [Oceanibaculum nanhaiense]
MSYTLHEFAADIRAALTADPGPAGQEKVRLLTEKALRDTDFMAACFGVPAPKEREVLYEDADLGFAICRHVYTGAKDSGPHDHGPTWAIYGQAEGETDMTDWRIVTPPSGGKPGRVEKTRTYRLTPGVAHLYLAGDVHAPYRAGPTKLIRIEGRNTDKISRTPLEAAA